VSIGFVNNLPIAGRRWESFALLTPNATTDGPSGLISYRGISGSTIPPPWMEPTTTRH